MKISKSNLEKIIAEELRLVLAESKAEKVEKIGAFVSQAAEKKGKGISAKVTSNAKRKKFKSKKEAQEWTATQILKSLFPGHTATGTVGLATVGQALQNKVIKDLGEYTTLQATKGAKGFIKGAAKKLFGAYVIAELANYAIKAAVYASAGKSKAAEREWGKFQTELAGNAIGLVAFKLGAKATAATGGLIWPALAGGALLGFLSYKFATAKPATWYPMKPSDVKDDALTRKYDPSGRPGGEVAPYPN